MDSFRHEGLRGGVWHGTIEGAARPAPMALVHHGQRIAPAEVTALSGDAGWQVRVPLPLDRLTDGATTFLLVEDAGAGDDLAPGAPVIARLPMIAGDVIAADLQSELALLRAELELLKREFRRRANVVDDTLGAATSRIHDEVSAAIAPATAAAEAAVQTANAAAEAARRAEIATERAIEAAHRAAAEGIEIARHAEAAAANAVGPAPVPAPAQEPPAADVPPAPASPSGGYRSRRGGRR